MAAALKLQWGSAPSGTLREASLSPTGESEQQISFAAPLSGALWPALIAAGFSPILFKAPISPGWFFYAVGIGAAALWSIRRLFWREQLTLDLEQRAYVYRRGYWPNITSDEGKLDDIKSVVLDVLVRAGSKGGDYVTWIASLAFNDPAKTLAVANFKLEPRAYQYLESLARRLHLPAVDRTREQERTTAWTDTEKPVAARDKPAMSRSGLSDPPAGSRIEIPADAPGRRIVLPRAGGELQYIAVALMPVVPLLYTGMIRDIYASWPFFAFTGSVAVLCAIGSFTNKVVEESDDSIVITNRLLGRTLSTRTFDKGKIVDIALKPLPSRRGGEELQIRSADGMLNIKAGRLSAAEMKWLEQALLAMARPR